MKRHNLHFVSGIVFTVILAVLLVSFFSFTFSRTSAEGVYDVWDGTRDTTWYTGDKQEYEINGASAFAGIEKLIAEGNDFTGITLLLTSDLDLNGIEWDSVGSGYYDADENLSKTFNGTFDGKGKSIKGLNDTATATLSDARYYSSVAGLFGFIGASGEVKNLTVYGTVNTNDSDYSAGIAGFSYGKISNCFSYVAVAGKSYSVSGIAGAVEGGQVTRSVNYGTVANTPGSGMIIGGLIGITENASVTECGNEGAITAVYQNGHQYVGGLIGITLGSNTIKSCYNKADISMEAGTVVIKVIGGIVGQSINADTVSNCFNTGSITGTFKTDKTGSIIGEVLNADTVCYDAYWLDGTWDRAFGINSKGADILEEAKDEAYMRSEAFVADLGEAFAAKEGEYPLLSFTVVKPLPEPEPEPIPVPEPKNGFPGWAWFVIISGGLILSFIIFVAANKAYRKLAR